MFAVNLSKVFTLVVLIALVAGAGVLLCATEENLKADPFGLLSIGEPGPGSIDLKVWTSQTSREPFRKGDRVIVHVRTDRPAYLTVVGVSSAGTATILVPNKDMPDSRMEAGSIHTLFGDDSEIRLTLGGKVAASKLGFLVSSVPFRFDMSLLSEGKCCITVSNGTQDELKTVRENLQAMAKDPGFNQVLLSFSGPVGELFDLVVSTTPDSSRVAPRFQEKQLPSSRGTSQQPETVTGTQGQTTPRVK